MANISIENVDADNQIFNGQTNVEIDCINAGAVEGIVEYGGIVQTVSDWPAIASGASTITVASIDSGALPLGPHDIKISRPIVYPVISGIVVTESADGATISWTTDIAADSRIDWGLTTGYEETPETNPDLETAHSLVLHGAAGETLYHYKITSATVLGASAETADSTFTTLAAGYGSDLVLEFDIPADNLTLTVTLGGIGAGNNTTIDWGDGSGSDSITSSTDPVHTYGSAGNYIVTIPGAQSGDPTLQRIRFGSAGEPRLIGIKNIGSPGYLWFSEAFMNCTNITEFTTGVTDFTSITSSSIWRSFSGLSNLLIPPDVSGWNTTGIAGFQQAFWNWSKATGPILGLASLDTSSSETFSGMFQHYGAGSDEYDLAIDDWDVGSCAVFSLFLSNTKLPTARYDLVLQKWSAQTLVNTTVIDFGSSVSSDAQARLDMIAASNGYGIIDGDT